MGKELEALVKLKKLSLEDTNFKPYTIEELDVLVAREKHNQKVEKFSQQIENALKDYENTKARLDDTQTLLWEKKKKVDAFDIIVNKEVEIGLLKGILHADKSLHTASYYNSHFVATYRHLTQEEFDLLKEVLE